MAGRRRRRVHRHGAADRHASAARPRCPTCRGAASRRRSPTTNSRRHRRAEARLLGTTVQIDAPAPRPGPRRARRVRRVDYESGAYDATVERQGLRSASRWPARRVDARRRRRRSSRAPARSRRPAAAGTLAATPDGGRIGDLVGARRRALAVRRRPDRQPPPSCRSCARWPQATVEPRAPYAFRGTAIVNRARRAAARAGRRRAARQPSSGTVGLSAAFHGALERRRQSPRPS